MPAGPEPTDTGPRGWPVAGSIRVTVPSWLFATQTAFGPTAMPSGRPPTGTTWLVGRGVDLAHGVVAFVGHPHTAWPAGDGDREVAGQEVVACGRSGTGNREHGPGAAVGHRPGFSGPGRRHGARRGADRDLVDHGMGGRVDPRQYALGAIGPTEPSPSTTEPGRPRSPRHRPAPGRVDQTHRVPGRPADLATPGRATATMPAAAMTASAKPAAAVGGCRRAQPSSRVSAADLGLRRCRGVGEGGGAGVGAVTFGHRLAAIAAVERWVVGEDGRVQVSRRFPGSMPSSLGEQVAGTAVGGERLCLQAAGDQRRRELGVQPFPQRMVGGQLLQFAGERIVSAKRQVSIDPRLQRSRTTCGDLPQAGERVVGQVGRRAAAPQLQRLATVAASKYQQACSATRPAVKPSWNRATIQAFTVHPQGGSPQPPGDQDVPRRTQGPVRIQRPAQVDGARVCKVVTPPLGWIPAPDVLGQPVHRDDPVGLQQQQRKHCPLPRAAQRHRTPRPADLQRPRSPNSAAGLAGHHVSSHRPPRPVASPAARASGSRPLHHQACRASTAFQATVPSRSQGGSTHPALR